MDRTSCSSASARYRPSRVLIRQEGEMWMRPGARAMRFTATQVFSVATVAFEWKARFPLLGPLALQVVNRYGRRPDSR